MLPGQLLPQRIALFLAVEQKLDGIAAADGRQRLQQLFQEGGVVAAAAQEFGQLLHLGDADGGLDLVHAEVEAGRVDDLAGFAVAIAERAQAAAFLGQLHVGGEDHAAFAGRYVFRWVKAEAADIADETDVFSGELMDGAEGDGAIFDEPEVVVSAESKSAAHVGGSAMIMHNTDSASAIANSGFE